jgi:hypothetical protein
MLAITIFMVTVWLIGMSLYIPSILIDFKEGLK